LAAAVMAAVAAVAVAVAVVPMFWSGHLVVAVVAVQISWSTPFQVLVVPLVWMVAGVTGVEWGAERVGA
jgi:hypothetical protein